MASAAPLAELARLIADPSRAEILSALLDGRAWTGRELAHVAHITPSTASIHLQRLVERSLLTVVSQGRHRYYRIASSEVARALESLMVLAPAQPPRHPTARGLDADLRYARTCYDHLAGTVGVLLAESLRRSGAVELDANGAVFTRQGFSLFRDAGIAIDQTGRRPLCRTCLDWSERRWHLAGSVGAALIEHALAHDWIRRRREPRALTVTARGIKAFYEVFGLCFPER
jgi:DNA-binding transcriptional ArsR family regulator